MVDVLINHPSTPFLGLMIFFRTPFFFFYATNVGYIRIFFFIHFDFSSISNFSSRSILSGHLWVEVALVHSTRVEQCLLYWDIFWLWIIYILTSDSIHHTILGAALPSLLSVRSFTSFNVSDICKGL